MPPKSQYWKYFDKINDSNAKCRSCGKIIKTSGNTSNLKCHIDNKHSNLMPKHELKITTPSSSVTTFKEPSVMPPASAANVTLEMSESGSDCDSEKNYTINIKNSFCQPTLSSNFSKISQYAEMGSKGIHLTNSILYMICKDSQPFQMVENEGFLNLMKVACPLYKVPSRFTLKRMLETKYDVIREHFKVKLQKVSGFTLTTDIWTDTMQTRSFLGVTVLFCNEEERLESVSLGVYDLTQSHTAEYIADTLLRTCNEWNIETTKIVTVVTDAAANIVKAIEIAFGRSRHIHCFAHMLNLMAQKSIEKTPNLPDLIAAVKRIVTWFKQCVTASDELRRESDLKLIQDVSTRWNSTFYMIERFLRLRPAINNIINCHTSAPEMLNAKQIIDLTEVCEILRPIEISTREVCGEKYVTCSKVIPLTRLLTIKVTGCQPKQTIGGNLKNNVIGEIKKRLLQTENVNILAVATLMDPRFKNIHFQDALACSRAINTIKEMISDIEMNERTENDLLTENPTTQVEEGQAQQTVDIWNDHYKLVNEKNNALAGQRDTNMPTELQFYLKSPVADLKQDPLCLWKGLESTYPTLKKIAVKYLCCTATSTASERLFSKAGQLLYQQRNRLKGKFLAKLIFLQSVSKKYWDC